MILDKIIAVKKIEVERLKVNFPDRELTPMIKAAPRRRSLSQALNQGHGLRIIAEVKRASPSEGVIDGSARSDEVARQYQTGGAAAISVLTDTEFFHGSYKDLKLVKAAVDLPVLCKEFIVHEIQVKLAAAMGADAILLIQAVHPPERLAQLMTLAHELGLEVLLEVHNQAELNLALCLNPGIVGINNRDLKTMKTDLETTVALAPKVGPGRITVSESGLYFHEDLVRLSGIGVKAFLVGTSLMKARDRTQALRDMIED